MLCNFSEKSGQGNEREGEMVKGALLFCRGHFDILASSTCETFASRNKNLLHGDQTNSQTTNLEKAELF